MDNNERCPNEWQSTSSNTNTNGLYLLCVSLLKFTFFRFAPLSIENRISIHHILCILCVCARARSPHFIYFLLMHFCCCYFRIVTFIWPASRRTYSLYHIHYFQFLSTVNSFTSYARANQCISVAHVFEPF